MTNQILSKPGKRNERKNEIELMNKKIKKKEEEEEEEQEKIKIKIKDNILNLNNKWENSSEFKKNIAERLDQKLSKHLEESDEAANNDNAPIREFFEQVNEVLKKIKADSEESRSYCMQRFLTILNGGGKFIVVISAGIGGVYMVYSMISQSQKTENTKDLESEFENYSELLKAVRKFVDVIRAQDDIHFWDQMSYVLKSQESGNLKPPITLGDQVLFMNYTIDLFPANKPFIWKTWNDKYKQIDESFEIYNKNEKMSEVYAHYASPSNLKYEGNDIPRSIVAEIIRACIAKILLGSTKQTTVQTSMIGCTSNMEKAKAAPYFPIVLSTQDKSAKDYAIEFLKSDPGIMPYLSDQNISGYIDQFVQGNELKNQLAIELATIEDLKDVADERHLTDLKKEAENYFLDRYRDRFHLPDGEEVIHEEFTALYKPIKNKNGEEMVARHRCAFRRTTNKADLLFIINQELRFENDAISIVPIRLPKRSQTREPINIIQSSDDVINVIQMLSPALATLAFALPEPWGILISAGITFASDLLGSAIKNDSVSDAIAKLLKNSETETLISRISNFTTYVINQMDIIETLTVDQLTAQLEESSGFLQILRQSVTPNTSAGIYSPLYELIKQNAEGPKTAKDLSNFKDILKILISGATIYAIALKQIVQSTAYLAGQYEKNVEKFNHYTNLWYGDFANLKINLLGDHSVDGLLKTIDNILTKIVENRINAISKLDSSTVYPIGSGVGTVYFYRFKDSWIDEEFEKEESDGLTQSKRDHSFYDKWHTDYVNNARKEIENDISAFKDFHGKFMGYISEWKGFEPPNPPKDAIGKIDFSISQTRTPTGPWQDNSTVQYAIQFKNEVGPSPIGPWSQPIEIEGLACPMVRDIPIDQLGMSRSRIVWRKFDNDDAHAKVVTVIPNNTETEFRDMDKKNV